MTPDATGRDDAAVARVLQQGLGPSAIPDLPGLAVDARYSPGGIGDVGGDWYDILELPGDGVAFVIGDVAGHGITAATAMGQLRHALRAFLLDERSPGAVLAKANRLIRWLLPSDVATAAIAIVNADRTTVAIASAGHPPILCIDGDLATFAQTHGGTALGLDGEAQYADTVIALSPGAGLLLYTDGLFERRDEPLDAGLQRLAEATARHRGDAALLDRLIESVPSAAGRDDLAVVVAFVEL